MVCQVHSIGHSANKVFAKCYIENTRQKETLNRNNVCRVSKFKKIHSAKMRVCRVSPQALSKEESLLSVFFSDTRQTRSLLSVLEKILCKENFEAYFQALNKFKLKSVQLQRFINSHDL